MLKKLAVTFFGFGLLPIAPGTWGSFAAAGVFLLITALYPDVARSTLGMIVGGLTILASAVGIALGKWAIDYYHQKDPKPFVLDEVAGQWLSLLLIPFATTPQLLTVVVTQFFLFRAFDIIKPPPARQAETLPGAWGIVADDLLAGVYANLCGQFLFRFLLPMI